MASGPYADHRRGTWTVQWFDGVKWCRTTVVKRRKGWKPGDPMSKKAPPEAIAALADYTLKEQSARARKSPAEHQTIGDFLAAYRETYPQTHEPASVLALDNAIRIFLGWCETKRIKMAAGLTTADCDLWISERAASKSESFGRPIQRATLLKDRALLAAAWNQAVRRDHLPKNPWKAARVEGKPTKKKRGAWTPDQYKALLAVSRPWLRDVLTLGCNCGLRIEALMGLEWRDIKWNTNPAEPDKLGMIVVRPELDKVKRGYEVPISHECHDMLSRRFIHRDAHEKFVLTTHQGRPIARRGLTDKAIRAACRRANLKNPDSPNHHMRRSFGRWAAMGHLTGEPIPMYVVSQWLGHTSIKMTQDYLELNEEDSAGFMVPKWAKGGEGGRGEAG